MVEERRRVEEGLRLFERLESAIPGFKGYKQKEIRRESDRLVRQQAAVALSKASDDLKRSLGGFIHPISDERMRIMNELLARLDRLKEKTSKATSGYSGFFDAVKVKEDKLDQILELDYSLIAEAKSISDSASKLSKDSPSNPSWSKSVDELRGEIERFEASLIERDRILKTA